MQREVVLVIGKTGSGKTTWAKNFIRDKTRVLILDAGFGDYSAREHENLSDLIDETEKQNCNGSGFFRFSYTPRSSESGVILDLARVTGNCWLVLEEADRLDDPRYMPEYDEVISRGRHYGVNILAVSLYPFKLPADLRRQATRLICYRMHEPRDLDYLYDVIGSDVELLPNLKPFHYLDWRAGHGSEIIKPNGKPFENRDPGISGADEPQNPAEPAGDGPSDKLEDPKPLAEPEPSL